MISPSVRDGFGNELADRGVDVVRQRALANLPRAHQGKPSSTRYQPISRVDRHGRSLVTTGLRSLLLVVQRAALGARQHLASERAYKAP